MIEEIFNELKNVLEELKSCSTDTACDSNGNVSFKVNGSKVKYNISPDSFLISIESNDDFEDYIKSIPDDIFIKACEKFDKLNELSTKPCKQLVNEFKEIVKDTASDILQDINDEWLDIADEYKEIDKRYQELTARKKEIEIQREELKKLI